VKDEKEIKLEEVKSKETVREATAEEFRALLEAEFDGRDEVQTSKEISVEEFTRLETKHDKTIGGELVSSVSSSEEHKSNETKEGPQWTKKQINPKNESSLQDAVPVDEEVTNEVIAVRAEVPQLQAFLPSFNITAPSIHIRGPSIEATGPQFNGQNILNISGVQNVTLPEPSSPADSNLSAVEINLQAKVKGGGLNWRGKPKKHRSKETVSDTRDSDDHSSGAGSLDYAAHGGVHHEVKHKRHVIEEIIIEDSDKFYENQEKKAKTLPKKKVKAITPGIELKFTDDRRRSTGELIPIDPQPPAGSAQNVSAQEITFMVEYEPPTSNVRLPTMPKVGMDWHGFGKRPKSMSEDPGEIKPKRQHQEEVVVFDGEMHVDTLERKKFPFSKKVGVHGKSMEAAPDSFTCVVQSDLPEGHAKVKPPHIEGDLSGGISASLPDVKYKSTRQQEIVVDDPNSYADKPSAGWNPKFGFKMPTLTKRHGSLDITPPSVEPETITFVVNGDDIPGKASHGDISIEGQKYPKFKLSGGKSVEVKIPKTKQEEMIVDGDTQYEDRTGFKMPSIHLPNITLPSLNISGKQPEQHNVVVDANIKEPVGPESINFVVTGVPAVDPNIKGDVGGDHKWKLFGSSSLEKIPRAEANKKRQDEVVIDGESKYKDSTGFKMPSIHMPDIQFPSLKRSGKKSGTIDADSGDATVTFVVQEPAVDVKIKGDVPQVDAKLKSRSQEELVMDGQEHTKDKVGFKFPSIHGPNIKFPTFSGKGEADLDEPESVTFIIQGQDPAANVKVKGDIPSMKVKGDLPAASLKVKSTKQEELVVDGDQQYEDNTRFKMPSIHGPDIKFPSLKFGTKGSNRDSTVTAESEQNDPKSITFVVNDDHPATNLKVKGQLPTVDPKIKGQSQDELVVNGEHEDKIGIKMPSIHVPDIKFPSLKFSGKGSKQNISATADSQQDPQSVTFIVNDDLPAANLKVIGQLPSGDLKVKGRSQEELVIDGEHQYEDKTGFKMPSINVPDIKFPSLKFSNKGSKQNISATGESEQDPQSVTFIVNDDLPAANLKVKGQLPSGDLKVKGHRQDEIVVDGEHQYEDKTGFKMPSINVPDIKFPSLKFSSKGSKPGIPATAESEEDPQSVTFIVNDDIPAKNLKIKGKVPTADIKVKGHNQEELVIDGEQHHEDKSGFKMPSINVPDIKFPSLKFSGKESKQDITATSGPEHDPQSVTFIVNDDLPAPNLKVKGDIPAAGVKIEKYKQDEQIVEGDQQYDDKTRFKMPSINIGEIKFPSMKFSGKGEQHNLTPESGINDPESMTFIVHGDVPASNINSKGDSTSNVKIKGSLPTANAKVKRDLPAPSLKVKGHKQEEIVVDGIGTHEVHSGFKMPTIGVSDIKFPSLKFSGKGQKHGSVTTAESDIPDPETVTFVVQGDLPAANVEAKGNLPEVNMKIKADRPTVDASINGHMQEEIILDGDQHKGKTGFKMPSIHVPDFKFPSVNFSGRGSDQSNSSVTANDDPESVTFVVQGNLPSANVKVKGDLSATNVEAELPAAKGHRQGELIVNGDQHYEAASGFKMPSIHLPDIKFPSLKFSGKDGASEKPTDESETVTYTIHGDVKSHDDSRIKLPSDLPEGEVNAQGNVSAHWSLPSKPTWSLGRNKGKDVSLPVKDKQGEVILDDTYLHADKNPSSWLPSFKGSAKQPDVSVNVGPGSAGGQADLQQSTVSLASSSNSETITYIVTSGAPGGNAYAEKPKKSNEKKEHKFGRKRPKVDLSSPNIEGDLSLKGKRQEEIIVGGKDQYTEDQGKPLLQINKHGQIKPTLNIEPSRVHADVTLPETDSSVTFKVAHPEVVIPDLKIHKDLGNDHKWNIFGKKAGEYNMTPEKQGIDPVELTYRKNKEEVVIPDPSIHGQIGRETDDVRLQLEGDKKITIFGLPSFNINYNNEIEIPRVQANFAFEAPNVKTSGSHLQNGNEFDASHPKNQDTSLQSDFEHYFERDNRTPPSGYPEGTLTTSTPKFGIQLSKLYNSKDDSSIDRREETLKSDRPRSYLMPDLKLDGRMHTLDMSADSSGSHQHLSRMYTPGEFSFDGVLKPQTSSTAVYGSVNSSSIPPPPHFVVIAIDFGTTFSGYAFSFARDTDSIHMMRKWEGGDPGVINQKTPTTLLLTPEGEFHSFGFTARDLYHDLSPNEAKRWMYFEKFKMSLHNNAVSI